MDTFFENLKEYIYFFVYTKYFFEIISTFKPIRNFHGEII